MADTTDSTKDLGLLDKFNSITDFSKLQIHVIFNYMPFTDKTKELESPDSSSFTDEFIQNRIQDSKNQFNFSVTDNSFILDKNINKTELETLLPELNKKIEQKNLIDKQGNQGDEQGNQGDKLDKGGTRITKRQKKHPQKKNKHHSARKQK
jgi:hypothetical protein